MLAEYKAKSNKFLTVGFLVWFAGNALQSQLVAQGQYATLGSIVWLVGVGLFIYGCVNYAKGKGQH